MNPLGPSPRNAWQVSEAHANLVREATPAARWR